ncbi:histidinol-phosphate aminotransferase [Endozoicomonas montiporae]|uniref:Histidinol-phosphate aminotransferase n=2 Tax=Endozoicomonas montiporae TaxID=1027273 RepID=A0A081N252_9GAMM|nr:histidinol-phosphate transaminase [Endozoicomonas montiporae]AMO58519.1 histidinol-phosphate aminotransferase [Endozoicomonas montiporae CL-33]KEQ12525.1 histidinol-phosphate aminotransferase [Endozoicomonas montiporae]
MSIFKSHISQMGAYKPPLEGRDNHQHLLLDFNERVLPVAPAVKQALIDFINDDQLQVYPAYGNITQKIADYCGVKSEQVMITNGSDQGIDLIIRSACQEGDEAIIPGPTFAMYHQCAKVENLNIIEPTYSRENGFPKQAVIDAITNKTRLIVLANPNNPCGTPVARETILEIAKAAPQAATLVDECYFEYTRQTVCDAVEEYPNLLVTRTFSKTWGLPSVRLGYVISRKENIDALLNVRGPYDVNQLAVVAIDAALSNPEYTQEYVKEVIEVSKPMLEAFLDKKAIKYWPTVANYIWVFPDNPDAMEKHIRASGILVRPKLDANGRKGLRITLGNKRQTLKLEQCLSSFEIN